MAKSNNFLCLALLMENDFPLSLWGLDLSCDGYMHIPWGNIKPATQAAVQGIFELTRFDVKASNLNSYAIQLSQNCYFIISSNLRITRVSSIEMSAFPESFYKIVPIKNLLLPLKQFYDLSMATQINIFNADSNLGTHNGISYSSYSTNNLTSLLSMHVNLQEYKGSTLIVPYGVGDVLLYYSSRNDCYIDNLVITDTVLNVRGAEYANKLMTHKLHFINRGFEVAKPFRYDSPSFLESMSFSNCEMVCIDAQCCKNRLLNITDFPTKQLLRTSTYIKSDSDILDIHAPIRSLYAKTTFFT